MYSFDEFVEKVENEIKDWLPESAGNFRTEVRDVQKINEVYKGLIVEREGDPVSPTINLSTLYEDFEKIGNFEQVMEAISTMAVMRPEGLEVNMIEKYENAKDMLFIRVSSIEQNAAFLENVPHKEVDGLAITYHLLTEMGENGMGSTVVTNDLLEKYGISKEQLHEDALANSEKILAPDFETMSNVLGRMMGIDLKEPENPISFEEKVRETDFSHDTMFVLTNRTSINGAAVIFYPEVLETIGEQMQGNFYIIPSSTHEVLIVPEDGLYNYKELETIVRDINANDIQPKDFLSNSVYHYDSTEHVFERAETFAERSQEKAQEKTSVKDRLLAEAKEQCQAQGHPSQNKEKENAIG